MKRILIYSPSNHRAVDQQSQAELLLRNGHKVFLLTWMPKGPLHENFEKLGAEAYSTDGIRGRSVFFFINQAGYLARFCKTHKIDIVFSHLQSNAVVAGLARKISNIQCYYFRHNSDYVELMPSRKNKLLNTWANKLSPRIVAISGKVKEQLIKEGVAEKKIVRINYCYNFSRYRDSSLNAAEQIREKYKTGLLLLSVARLDPLKRHLMAFEVVSELIKIGIDCKLVSIGEGPMRGRLEEWIRQHGMENKIFLESFATNTIDYFEASDALIHLSYSEASSHVVKEAGMAKRAAIACHNVGDFDDYLQDGTNAIVADKENPVPQAIEQLVKYYANKDGLASMGLKLYHTVIDTFSMEAVEKQYQLLLRSKN